MRSLGSRVQGLGLAFHLPCRPLTSPKPIEKKGERVIRIIIRDCIPGLPKYVEQWPFGLYLGDLGHYFAYFGGLGSNYRSASTCSLLAPRHPRSPIQRQEEKQDESCCPQVLVYVVVLMWLACLSENCCNMIIFLCSFTSYPWYGNPRP